MLAAQWQACLDYDSSDLLPGCEVPIHAIAFSHDVQTPPARVREVADCAPHGRFHLLEGLGHGSAFGHRPDVVNACLRGIVEEHLAAEAPDAAHGARALGAVRDLVDGEAEGLEERRRGRVAGVVLDPDLGGPGGLQQPLEQQAADPAALRVRVDVELPHHRPRRVDAVELEQPDEHAVAERGEHPALLHGRAERVRVEELGHALLDRGAREHALVRRPPRPHPERVERRDVRRARRADEDHARAGQSSRRASSRLRTLPVALRGSSSRNTISRGTL